MRVNFNISSYKEPVGKIFLIAFIKGERLKFYTSVSVNPKNWDASRQEIKRNQREENHEVQNRYLAHIKFKFTEKYYQLLMSEDGPTVIELKRYLEELTFKRSANKRISLIDFWNKFIDRRDKDPSFSYGTVKTYITARNHFQAFCNIHGQYDFKHIDLRFIEAFKAHLFSLDLSVNYVEKIVQQLRVMLNEALEQNYHTNEAFKKKAFQVKKTATDEKYLNRAEIEKIRIVNLPEHLERVRDCFIMQCFSGVAYVDIPKVQESSLIVIDGVKVLFYHRGKTKKMAALPVHDTLDEVMYKRDWKPFKKIANQHYNRAIKEVCAMAGIDSQVSKINTRGGVEKSNHFKKYQLISSHTARRSFTTNYILSGGTRDDVKLMIGHLTQDVTETYIKAELQKRAALLSKRPFFT